VELFELHLAKGKKDMVLTGKVVKKSAFADVGGIRYVFDSGLNKAFPGKEIQGSAKETFAKFGAAALAAIGGEGGVGLGGRRRQFGGLIHFDHHPNMTLGHFCLNVKI
jgi:hypothetical protein